MKIKIPIQDTEEFKLGYQKAKEEFLEMIDKKRTCNGDIPTNKVEELIKNLENG